MCLTIHNLMKVSSGNGAAYYDGDGCVLVYARRSEPHRTQAPARTPQTANAFWVCGNVHDQDADEDMFF